MYEKINWSKIFLYFSSIFGLIFLILIPPFQTPDEPVHFYRAYQVSTGGLLSENKDGNLGGEIPTSIIELQQLINPDEISFNPQNKQGINQISTAFDIKLNSDDTVFVHFPSSAVYPPIVYLPQVIGIWVSKLLGLPAIYLIYFARIFSLAFYVFLIFKALKIIPILKGLLFIIALLPMSIQQSIAMGPDALALSTFILLVSIIFSMKFDESDIKISKKTFVVLLILCILIALSKYVYVFALLLLLLIPKEKFRFNKLKSIVGIWIVCFVLVLSWLLYTQSNDAASFAVDPMEQLFTIFQNPFYFIFLLFNTFIQNELLIQSYIGIIGWLDTRLPTIAIFFFVSFIGYILAKEATIFNNTHLIRKFSKFDLLVIITSAILMIFFTELLLYLAWHQDVNTNYIDGLQGRYFIIPSILVFALLIFMGKYLNKIFLIVLVIFLLIISFTLSNRYWQYSDISLNSEITSLNSEYPVVEIKTKYAIDNFEHLNSVLNIKGWVFYEELLNEDFNVLVVFNNGNETYSYKTVEESRPDVTNAFSDSIDVNLDNSGFNTNLYIDDVPPGKYKIYLYLVGNDSIYYSIDLNMEILIEG